MSRLADGSKTCDLATVISMVFRRAPEMARKCLYLFLRQSPEKHVNEQIVGIIGPQHSRDGPLLAGVSQ